MNTVKFSSNFGRFAFEAEADVLSNDKATLALATLGVGAACQSCGAAGEKALLGGGKRPEKWTRTDEGYSKEMASKLQVAIQQKLDEVTKEKGLPMIVFGVTSEYVSTEGAKAQTLAENMLKELAKLDPASVAAFGMMYGFAGDASDEVKLAALRAFFTKMQKA